MDIKKIRKEKINRLVVYEIMQWIDEHLEEPLKVEDVSAKAGYSKWHFQRMFKEVAGISLGKYIKLEKLRRAYFLLENTDIPVIEVMQWWSDYLYTCRENYVPPYIYSKNISHEAT